MGSVIFVAGVTMAVLVLWVNIISLRFGKTWKEGFGVELSFSQEQAAEGEPMYLFETIMNDKKQALPAVSVKFKTSRYLKFADEAGGMVSDYYYRNDVLSVQGYEKCGAVVGLFACAEENMRSMRQNWSCRIRFCCANTSKNPRCRPN